MEAGVAPGVLGAKHLDGVGFFLCYLPHSLWRAISEERANQNAEGIPMKEKERMAWFVEEDLINDSSLPGTVKHLLLVIHKSINLKKQVCWLSQVELARKMSKSRATAQRAF